MEPLVLSIGYERRSVEELIELLTDHGVERLLDVREAPISRKKGLSKKALTEHLNQAGIEYRHLRVAGNPHRKVKADLEHCLKLYEQHLAENPEVLDQVATELQPGPVAMLCYEREHRCCHRSVLLKQLQQHGIHMEVVQEE